MNESFIKSRWPARKNFYQRTSFRFQFISSSRMKRSYKGINSSSTSGSASPSAAVKFYLLVIDLGQLFEAIVPVESRSVGLWNYWLFNRGTFGGGA